MTHQYIISGMHCNSCVAKVQGALVATRGIQSATVSLDPPQATLLMDSHVNTDELNRSLAAIGNYRLEEKHSMPAPVADDMDEISGTTYFPLILIFIYLFGGVVLGSYATGNWEASTLMGNFMGGFFIIFSFFKLLDVKGFASSYSMYDVVAKRIKAWGMMYPFIELALGIAYLVRYEPVITNLATLAVMGISIIGVLQSILDKRQIKCACLGTVFNLPMSTVTLVEDGLMIAMSAAMLLLKM